MAQRNGKYAVLLGSGVSRAAGIPTGGQIFSELQNRLFQQYKIGDPDLSFDDWKNTAPNSYSEVLEALADTLAGRRGLLEPYFQGKQPTDAHRILANMVKEKMVKVIITTNFDHLMENALRDIGERYSVISSDSDLEQSEPREHANCMIYKIHGDYQKLNIRNTVDELSHLPSAITTELKEIFSRYGLIVLGYSGSDPAAMEIMYSTKSIYGRYWISPHAVEGNERLSSMLSESANHLLRFDTADEFIAELRQRINLFSSYEEDNPSQIYALASSFLEDGHTLRFEKMFRKYKAEFLREWPSLVNKLTTVEVGEIVPQIYNKLSFIISLGWVLLDHDHPEQNAFIEETLHDFSTLTSWINGMQTTLTADLCTIPLEVCIYSWGAHGIFRKNESFIASLLQMTIAERDDSPRHVKLGERLFSHNIVSVGNLVNGQLWDSIYAEESVAPELFSNYCAQFDFLRLTAYFYRDLDESFIPITYCSAVDYNKITSLITQFMHGKWNRVLGPIIRGDEEVEQKIISLLQKAATHLRPQQERFLITMQFNEQIKKLQGR